MRKGDLTEALHEGIAKAVVDFHTWSGGESIRDWGVESLLTVTCAQGLAARLDEVGSSMTMTLEESFAGIEYFSGRHTTRGRPKGNLVRIRDKPTGRVDIVLWNKRDTPRALIEIKRRDAKDGLERDARRIVDFLHAFGKGDGGTLRYGVVATVLQASADRPLNHFVGMTKTRSAPLETLAAKAGMMLETSGPRPIAYSVDAEGCRAASLVFRFTPER